MTNIDAFADAFGFNLKSQSVSCFWGEVTSVFDEYFEIGLPVITTDKYALAARGCKAEEGDRVLCVNNNGQLTAIARLGGDRESSWKFLASSSGTSTKSISGMSNYNEILVVVRSSNTSYGIVTGIINYVRVQASDPNDWYLGGGYTSGGSRRTIVSLSRSSFALKEFAVDGVDQASTCTSYVYGRK